MNERLLSFFLILLVSHIPAAVAWEPEIEDCGPEPEIIYREPVSIYFLLDLDASPEIMDRLIDDFPAIALHLAVLSSNPGFWFCEEDGVRAVYMPDQRANHSFAAVSPTAEEVRRLLRDGPEPPEDEMMPIAVAKGEPGLWAESSVSRLPNDQLQMTITYSAIKHSALYAYEVVKVLGVVRLRLRLKEKNAVKWAWTEGAFADLYEIAEIVETIPDRQLEPK